jgi:integrase
MGLREKNGRWHYRFQFRGLTVAESTGLEATKSNHRKAGQMEAAHRLRLEEGKLGIRTLKPLAFADAVPEFIDWCKGEYEKETTWRRIETSMTSAKVHFAKQAILEITAGDVERYKSWRRSQGIKPVSLKHDLNNLSVFFKWAIKEHYASANPTADVKKPSDANAIRQRVLSTDEEKLYFSHAKGNLWKVARLIINQGLRPEEVIRIRKEDVDLERGLLRVRFGKTKAAKRTLKLMPESRGILAAQLNTPGPWIFPSAKLKGQHITKLNGTHDRVCERIKLFFVLYDLRHTFATRLAAAGANAFAIAAILGHSGTRVIDRYVHPTQGTMDAAMDLLFQSCSSVPSGPSCDYA